MIVEIIHSSPLYPPKTVAKIITEMNEDKKTTTNKQKKWKESKKHAE